MSFKLTPQEQSRIDIAEFLGVRLDPIGAVDLSTIVVLSTMYGVEFIALCYQLHNRNYPPLKVKNVPVMFALFFGGVGWLLGDIFTGGVAHLHQSPVLRNCKLTGIWFRVCIGAYYVTSGFALRCYSLYCVFCKQRAFSGKNALVSLAITLASILVFGTVSTLVPADMTTHYEEILDMCYYRKAYIVSVLTVIWAIWLWTAAMCWKLRSIPFCFNEGIELVSCFVIMLALSVMNTICLLVVHVYPASLAWRTSLAYCNHVGASLGYWIVMFEPTYNCIFDREGYLAYWVSILKEEDMARQYEYSTAMNNETTMNLVEHTDALDYPSSHCRISAQASNVPGSLESTRIGHSPGSGEAKDAKQLPKDTPSADL
ncbi:hypothetical protein IW140_005873 [Coemansia sp. RSA 1813]|nr:hypothetical protein EV178_006562 [Coemansia sp. RSA 1646]KAJ1765461.1 hypothetical protein LPJ74_006342 [Coemansia sp. RSA 1843]KAJ2084835.1 hypothetical protein IW138_006565 [Coemansia sp. RSA 986]KAJ2211789.1 hypothetical protein EV179_005226 [Coemansia sp. RSA 487]KAJ2564092.1 hypothetical protein IW140_005873 [Coemansia sp. RSA 1813]